VSGRGAGGRAEADPTPPVERDESTEFLLQSLRDLERERAAGDIDEDDYRALADDYTARAAAALRAEQRGQAPPPAPKARRSGTQWLLIVVALVAFAGLTGWLVADASGRREGGQGITGDITRTPTQEAGRCIDLTVENELVKAIPCYEDVLEDDPDNPAARTYLGWTLFLTASTSGEALPQETVAEIYAAARRQLDRAVEADPRYADARAFQIAVAVREGRFADAAEHLEAFDALDAPADIANLVDGVRQEIDEGLEEAGATTTAPTTAPSGGAPGASTTATTDPP